MRPELVTHNPTGPSPRAWISRLAMGFPYDGPPDPGLRPGRRVQVTQLVCAGTDREWAQEMVQCMKQHHGTSSTGSLPLPERLIFSYYMDACMDGCMRDYL